MCIVNSAIVEFHLQKRAKGLSEEVKRCYGPYHQTNDEKYVSLDQFGNDKSSKDGIRNVCRTCTNRYQRDRRRSSEKIRKQTVRSTMKHYRNNKVQWLDNQKTYLQTVKGFKSKLISQARCRARDKNISFDITVDDINIPEYCPVFGFKLNLRPSPPDKEFSPSMDRIDSSQGYTKDNIIIISWRANKLKSNASLTELQMLYEFYNGITNASSKE